MPKLGTAWRRCARRRSHRRCAVRDGADRPLSGLAESVTADVNGSPRPVVSIDLPSGLSADTHEVPGPPLTRR
jgi:hypothetical protein